MSRPASSSIQTAAGAAFRFAAICLGLGLPRAQENLSQWAHYRELTLNTSATGANVAATQVKFPILVRLGSDQADVFSGSAGRGADLRFAKSDGKSLPHQVERWDSAGQRAEIWVGLDTVKGNTAGQAFRMYWGKAGAPDSSKGAGVFDTANGFRGVWHLGGNVADAGGQGNHGIDSGTADAAEGAIGRGRFFDNPVSYVTGGRFISLGNPAGMNFTGRITMQAWVRWTRRDGHRIILCHGSASGSANEIVLRVGENNDYRAGVWTGTAIHATLAQAQVAPDSNAWIHLAGVNNGSAWILYRNGVQAGTMPADAQGARTSPGNWRIGAQWVSGSGAYRFFSGYLDEVRLANVDRSADWLKLEYENQKSGQTMLAMGGTMSPVGIPGARGGRHPALTMRFAGRELLTMALPAGDEPGTGPITLSLMDSRGRVMWSASAVPSRKGDAAWEWEGRRGREDQALLAGTYLCRVAFPGGRIKDRIVVVTASR